MTLHSPTTPDQGYVTAAWVKKRFSIANSTLYAWIGSGRLPPPVKIGPRAVRFRLSDIEAFEAQLCAPSADRS
jgi:predicted DNA-binding transcriptional regulator AlpA